MHLRRVMVTPTSEAEGCEATGQDFNNLREGWRHHETGPERGPGPERDPGSPRVEESDTEASPSGPVCTGLSVSPSEVSIVAKR